MSSKVICGSCHKPKLHTKTAVVAGKYYKHICLDCLGSVDDDISSNVAGYERRRGYEDHASDTIQPYDANGQASLEFARLYPQAAKKVFGDDIFNNLRSKI